MASVCEQSKTAAVHAEADYSSSPTEIGKPQNSKKKAEPKAVLHSSDDSPSMPPAAPPPSYKDSVKNNNNSYHRGATHGAKYQDPSPKDTEGESTPTPTPTPVPPIAIFHNNVHNHNYHHHSSGNDTNSSSNHNLHQSGIPKRSLTSAPLHRDKKPPSLNPVSVATGVQASVATPQEEDESDFMQPNVCVRISGKSRTPHVGGRSVPQSPSYHTSPRVYVSCPPVQDPVRKEPPHQQDTPLVAAPPKRMTHQPYNPVRLGNDYSPDYYSITSNNNNTLPTSGAPSTNASPISATFDGHGDNSLASGRLSVSLQHGQQSLQESATSTPKNVDSNATHTPQNSLSVQPSAYLGCSSNGNSMQFNPESQQAESPYGGGGTLRPRQSSGLGAATRPDVADNKASPSPRPNSQYRKADMLVGFYTESESSPIIAISASGFNANALPNKHTHAAQQPPKFYAEGNNSSNYHYGPNFASAGSRHFMNGVYTQHNNMNSNSNIQNQSNVNLNQGSMMDPYSMSRDGGMGGSYGGGYYYGHANYYNNQNPASPTDPSCMYSYPACTAVTQQTSTQGMSSSWQQFSSSNNQLDNTTSSYGQISPRWNASYTNNSTHNGVNMANHNHNNYSSTTNANSHTSANAKGTNVHNNNNNINNINTISNKNNANNNNNNNASSHNGYQRTKPYTAAGRLPGRKNDSKVTRAQ